MGSFDFLRRPDVNRGVKDHKSTVGAVLLDVRTPMEYSEGHIPESRNVPLETLDEIAAIVENKATALFVYCHSGARSSQAVAALRQMGYTRVNNIGGIASYRGRMER